MSIRDWLTTAASNIGLFPENMPRNQVNDSARQLQAAVKGFADELPYYEFTDTVTYASANVFSVTGDYTATLPDGSRVRAQGVSTGTINGRVTGTSFAGSSTAVTVEWDDGGALSNETLRVWKNVAGLDYFAAATDLDAGTDAFKAITSLVLTQFIQSKMNLAANGHFDFFGLEVRWGTQANVSLNSPVSVTFPQPFNNECFGIVATASENHNAGADSNTHALSTYNRTTSGFSLKSGFNDQIDVFYIAIGR